MRKCWKTPAMAVLMATIAFVLPARAQQTVKEAAALVPDRAAFAKRVRPDDKFEVLGRFAGSWEGTFKVLLLGGREVAMKETLEAKWILGDSFIDAHFSSAFPAETLQGRATMGYNGGKEHFYRMFLSGADPRGTYSTGQYIRSSNALVFTGMEADPVTGDSFEKRDAFTFVDKDRIFYELFYTFADGSEIKVLEGYYTRVAGK